MKNYRIRIATEGSEFEVEGDKAFVLEMLKRYQTARTELVSPSRVTPGVESKSITKSVSMVKQTSNTKVLSIREFIQKLSFTKHTDISLAFGFYLEKHSGVSDFSSADINTCYYEAKIERSNTSQMIIQNIKRGYMMDSKTKGEKGKNKYTLTSTGEEFIVSKLSGNT